MLPAYVEESKGKVLLRVYVQPKAAKTEVVGLYQDRLKVRVQAPPVEGKANAALIKFFSKTLAWPKSQIQVISGQKGRSKTLEFAGASWLDFESAFAKLLE